MDKYILIHVHIRADLAEGQFYREEVPSLNPDKIDISIHNKKSAHNEVMSTFDQFEFDDEEGFDDMLNYFNKNNFIVLPDDYIEIRQIGNIDNYNYMVIEFVPVTELKLEPKYLKISLYNDEISAFMAIEQSLKIRCINNPKYILNIKTKGYYIQNNLYIEYRKIQTH